MKTMMRAIRKFGLAHCDLETMLWNVSSMLRTLTLNIDSKKKKIPVLYYFITVTLAACYFYVYLVCMAWVVWRSPQTGDFIGATIVASLGITSEISTTKFIAMLLYIKEIRELVDLYRACNSLVVPGSRFYDNLMKRLRIVKKRAIVFWIAIIGNGLVYISTPLFRSGRHLMEDSFTIYGFEPTFESPNYEISLALMTGGLIFIVYFPANISAFLIIITGYTEAQMISLSEEVLLLWSNAEEKYRDTTSGSRLVESSNEYKIRHKIINEFVKQRLCEIIEIHTTNIYIVQKVERVYRGSTAVEFILLTFGIIVELLGRLENTYLQIPFALMQVAMDCFSGQRVMDASLEFEKAVYACKWENFSAANMKTVHLMLQMSQKNLKLSAGGVTMLNFVSFAGVIRIIYSGYTALRQLY